MAVKVSNAIEAFKKKLEAEDVRADPPATTSGLKRAIRDRVKQILDYLDDSEGTLAPIEKYLVVALASLGRLLVAYFVASRQRESAEREREYREAGFTRQRVRSRIIGTWFGKVRVWRTCMSQPDGSGTVPLDRALGLTADTFSRAVISVAAKIATFVSYDRVTAVLLEVLGWSPSKTSVEHAVLGLARYSERWFESKPAPKGDGDVLVVEIDCKATPTATEEELRKRRGKRKPAQYPDSPRHRGREQRSRRGSKRRRKKGDKSKNGKAATVVVLYTLKTTISDDGEIVRLGPINKEVYAAYRGRRHAFEMARKLADKRGFEEGSGKTVQLLSDGDPVLEDYAREFFPDAESTLDVYHALEYVWKAGCCLFEEGSEELDAWYYLAKSMVYEGKVALLLQILAEELERIPKTGPGNKGKRGRLANAISYLDARVERMDYSRLQQEDLEISTGAVEGAVRYVVGERFDCAGMRWIKERAEALLQLRCIELNGQWERFIEFAYARLFAESDTFEQLPTMLLNARHLRAEAA